MADIFISYSKKHAQLTIDLARDLEQAGYTTWWDASLMADDMFFPQRIRDEIDAARVVIVIWAEHSVKSQWVYSEASIANGQNKLLQVRDSDLNPDRVLPPFNVSNIPFVADRKRIFETLERRDVSKSKQPAPPPKPSSTVPGNVLTQVTVTEEPPLYQPKVHTPSSQPRQTVRANPDRVLALAERLLHADSQVLQDPLAAGGYEDAARRLIRTLKGHGSSIRAVAVSSDGKTVVSGSLDNIVKLWEAGTEELIRTLKGGGDWGRAVALSADAKTVVSGNWDNTIKMWDLGTGKLIRTLEGHESFVFAVAVSDDGNTVVSGSGGLGGNDKTVRLWDAGTGKLIRILKGHGWGVRSVAVSRDGKTVVSGCADNTFTLWDAHTGKLMRTLEGYVSGVVAVAVSDDAKTIVSGNTDNTVKLWDGESGRLIRTLEGHGGWVRAVAISGYGKTVVSGSDDNTVKLWDVSEWTQR